MKANRFTRAFGRIALVLTPALLVVASAANESDKAAATKGMVKRSDLEIVDCLLPGQVRQLGNSTFLSQRRPIRTTTAECSIRGGEYVAYDRADIKQALRIWQPTAEGGDPEAMTNVGEIYERGMGVPPDYVVCRAVVSEGGGQGLFARAVQPGHDVRTGTGRRAGSAQGAESLSTGMGHQRGQHHLRVRRAARAGRAAQAARRSDLREGLAARAVAEAVEGHAGQAREAAGRREDGADNSKEVDALKKWIAQLENERKKSSERLAGIPKTRTPSGTTELTPIPPTADERTLAGMNFGRYYAIVIGNQNYQSIESLQTPKYDAARAARILADKYGFTVQILDDANDITMLKTINDLNAVLKPEDNVLIYYAGHGTRLKSGQLESGYWLPVNADAPPEDRFWIPNEQITGHLGRLTARRVLVVADSCYSGLLSTDPSYLFLNDKVAYSKEYIKFKLPKRSRLLLSSGGDKPVLDEGSGGNSVFARAFLDELEANQGILSSPELFSRIRKRVEVAAAKNKFVQTPEFKSIKGAGHEVGDFFFVPRSKPGVAGP